MKKSTVHKIAQQYQLELVETHISWVLLGREWVYKIKKPIHFSFLDFSTLEKRRFFCEQELKLNQRLTHGVYLAVVPIFKQPEGFSFGEGTGTLMDYALKMKRLDNQRQMDKLLKVEAVSERDLFKIAQQLALFHQQNRIEGHQVDIQSLQADFEDIRSILPVIQKYFGKAALHQIETAIDFSNTFLNKHANRLQQRADDGFFVDGHGDLHSGNIFLLQEPVIFDCIEFDTHLRQLDVLNELAFLGMDLEAHGRYDLSEKLELYYLSEYPVLEQEEDQLLLNYFKWYRSNVRLKVNALKISQAKDVRSTAKLLDQIDRYLALFRHYFVTINVMEPSFNSFIR